jgi:transcriptional regulator with XRE-family HTH domain
LNSDPDITHLISLIIDIIHERRTALAVSKKRLAEMSGVTRTAILLMERHDRSPSLELLLRLARALEIPFSEVVREAELRSKRPLP